MASSDINYVLFLAGRITVIIYFKMVTRKRVRRGKVFYHYLEGGVRLKAEKICKKIQEKMVQEKLYGIEERA